MELDERLKLFSDLGIFLKDNLDSEVFEEVLLRAKSQNAWFTTDNLKLAISNIVEKFLNFEKLTEFVNHYPIDFFNPEKPLKIGIVAAGNIPLVGLQDLIHVLLSGHIAYFKPSSQDKVLTDFIIGKLKELNPKVDGYLVTADRLNNLDAYIATGSGNTSRYFEYYFGTKPNIIRKNRTSVAILNGNETRQQLANLGNDIFSYFGLGCRNVSKLYVPVGYDFKNFFEAIEYWNSIIIHSKYHNNYDYNKSILLVNRDQHLDNGFLLLKESAELHSPISVLFYEEYKEITTVLENLEFLNDNLQCIVSDDIYGKTGFGKTQSPELWDFADHIDTIQFLSSLN